MIKYRITTFGMKSYKTEILTSFEAIKKYGINRFTSSINANGFYHKMVSERINDNNIIAQEN